MSCSEKNLAVCESCVTCQVGVISAAGVFRPDAHGSATVLNPPLPGGVEAKTFAITVEPEQGILGSNLAARYAGQWRVGHLYRQPKAMLLRPGSTVVVALIIFLAFSVILVTLVLQGLTLPSLIRALGLAGTAEEHPEETEARRTILQAALDYLEQSQKKTAPAAAEVYEDLAQHYHSRLIALAEDANAGRDSTSADFYSRYLELSRELLRVERQTAIQLRNGGRIGDDLLREIEHELDLSEARLKAK